MLYRHILLIGAFAYVSSVESPYAQETCDSVLQCANAMVKLANELKTDNALLLQRVADLEKLLAEKVSALDERIKGVPNGKNLGKQKEGDVTCPEGSYATGIWYDTYSGGSHGIPWKFTIICRKFSR